MTEASHYGVTGQTSATDKKTWGLAYLQAVCPAHETDHERTGTLALIAWAQHLLGEQEESAAAMQPPRTLDDEHPAVKRIKAKMPTNDR